MKNLQKKLSDMIEINDKRFAVELDSTDVRLLGQLMKKYNIRARSRMLKEIIKHEYYNEFTNIKNSG